MTLHRTQKPTLKNGDSRTISRQNDDDDNDDEKDTYSKSNFNNVASLIEVIGSKDPRY